MSQQNKSLFPIIGVVIVAIVLLGLVYANVTGALALSGAKVVSSGTATAIVVVLFLVMLVWMYRNTQQ